MRKLGTARLRRLAGRIVFLSSRSAYGEAAEKASCVTPVVEELPLLASEPYGSSKVACEAMLRAYVRQQAVDAVALRVSIVYGPGRTTYCGITRMLQAALAGQPIPLDRGAEVPLPWVHIDDLIAQHGAPDVCGDVADAFDRAQLVAHSARDPAHFRLRRTGHGTHLNQ